MGGNQFHEQCNNVPNQFSEGLVYHRECYQKFTRAISELNKRGQSSSTAPVLSAASSSQSAANSIAARSKRSRETYSAGSFPDYCMICKKKEKLIRTKCDEKREYPTKLTLDECEKIVPEVVVLHNDQEMMN